jgi:hypothetical protein
VYQVGGKSFVFFRNPGRRSMRDRRALRRRHRDLVESEDDKAALVQDPGSPFFTTDHFNGHRSVLVRASRLGGVTREEMAELIQDAWLSGRRPPGGHLAGRAPLTARGEPRADEPEQQGAAQESPPSGRRDPETATRVAIRCHHRASPTTRHRPRAIRVRA